MRETIRNVRLYYPYRQYTDLFIFLFVSLLCLCSTLRLCLLLLLCQVGSSTKTIDPELIIFPNAEGKNRLYIKVEEQGCFHARVTYKDQAISNGSFVIISLVGKVSCAVPFNFAVKIFRKNSCVRCPSLNMCKQLQKLKSSLLFSVYMHTLRTYFL